MWKRKKVLLFLNNLILHVKRERERPNKFASLISSPPHYFKRRKNFLLLNPQKREQRESITYVEKET